MQKNTRRKFVKHESIQIEMNDTYYPTNYKIDYVINLSQNKKDTTQNMDHTKK